MMPNVEYLKLMAFYPPKENELFLPIPQTIRDCSAVTETSKEACHNFSNNETSQIRHFRILWNEKSKYLLIYMLSSHYCIATIYKALL
jgi:hypothetical protein